MVNAISNFYDENLVFNHIIYKDLNVKNFPTHSHNLCEFLFVKRANASYVIENREYHLKENDLMARLWSVMDEAGPSPDE